MRRKSGLRLCQCGKIALLFPVLDKLPYQMCFSCAKNYRAIANREVKP